VTESQSSLMPEFGIARQISCTVCLFLNDDASLVRPALLVSSGERCYAIKRNSGCRAPLERKEQGPQALRLYSYENAKKMHATDWQSIIHPMSIQARFDTAVDRPLEVPFVHAAFLVSKTLAERILFDESYTGNCYREETDFLIRARASGARGRYGMTPRSPGESS